MLSTMVQRMRLSTSFYVPACFQVLTHVREKLHSVTCSVDILQNDLLNATNTVTLRRSELMAAKQRREQLRAANTRAAAAISFAHDDALAADFEARRQAAEGYAAAAAALQHERTVLLAVCNSSSARSIDV